MQIGQPSEGLQLKNCQHHIHKLCVEDAMTPSIDANNPNL